MAARAGAISGQTLAYRGKADGVTKGCWLRRVSARGTSGPAKFAARVEPDIRLLLIDDDLGKRATPPYGPTLDVEEQSA